MKKIIKLLFVVCVVLTLGACTKKSVTEASEDTNAASSTKIKVVATIFPEYDWVREVAKDKLSNIDLTLLLDNGVDLHSYQPTAEDIKKISECDLFIYVGGESDRWVEGALKEAVNKNMVVVNLMETLGEAVKEEEVIEGMQEEEHPHDEEEHDHEDMEYDEHVWLSLRHAQIFTSTIAESLGKLDKENATVYEANAKAYNEKLAALDVEYANVIDASSNKSILFGDRFPFRYLIDDYGMTYYAAFVGCSAETEASFATVRFLAEKVDEKGLNVFTIENSDQKIAKTIIENTKNKDVKILTLDSLQATTLEDVGKGTTYLKVMETNLEQLKLGLN